MRIGIVGTGIVGQNLGAKLIDSGHVIMFGTRDVEATLARTEPDAYNNPPLSQWRKEHPAAKLGSFEAAARHGQIVANATAGAHSLAALNLAGADSLRDKILIDIANPLDFSGGFPPSLSVCNTDSLGERIQACFPATKVVKTLNTMSSFVMVDPTAVPGDHNVFMSGNDAEAKVEVSRLLSESLGWPLASIIDLGDISTARGTEMLLPIWVRLFGATGHPMFNFHVAVGREPQTKAG